MTTDDVEAMLPLVYDHLRIIARRIHRERGESVHATSVVHETFLKLAHSEAAQWESRAHFLALAAKAMRQVVADRARARKTAKRGGDLQHLTLTGIGTEPRVLDIVSLNRALTDLSALDPRGAEVAEMKLLAGMTLEEMALATGRSERTVRRDWRGARAWLVDRLEL